MLLENLLIASEHLAGFAIVMCTLAVLWGLTALMGRVVARMESATAAPLPRPGAKPMAPVARASDDISDDELVVIAATAATMFGARHHIVSIRPHVSTWGHQGRRDIHASHRIR